MKAFWSKGYEATSLADLMSATGLHKGSLYQAFGDKHSLFVQALDRYLQEMRRQKTEILAGQTSPLAGIRAVMHAMVDIADGDSECPRGCLAINSLVELAPHDDKVQEVLWNHLRTMRASMEEQVAAAQAAGEMTRERSPELVTTMLITFMDGIAVMLKGPLSNAEAHDLLDAQIGALT